MELIVLINLAFSVVGFFFIVRMWKEVKERRDYYGEHFAIPTGANAIDTGTFQQAPVIQSQQQPEQMSMEQLTAAVVAAMQQNRQQGAVSSDGDLQRLIANAAAQNGGGA